jgi:hypothetical protein
VAIVSEMLGVDRTGIMEMLISAEENAKLASDQLQWSLSDE